MTRTVWRCALAVRCGLALATTLLATASAIAQVPGDSLVLEGNFIRTGVSNNGTLGVGGNISPGFIFDATGTATFDSANDYLTPGSPHEGFSLSFAGSGVLLNNNAGNTVGIGSATAPVVVDSVTSGFDYAVKWSATIAATLSIEHLYGLNDDGKQVVITTTITALTDLDNLLFARWIDPDSGGTSSINTRGNVMLGLSPENWVNSESEVNGATLGLFSSSSITHNTAISPAWSTDPAFYIAGSGDTVGDHTIGIGFNIGSLTNGDSAVLRYSYAVAADPDDFEDLLELGVWTGATNSDFDEITNWNPQQVAGDGDAVRIESAGNSTVNHNATGNTYTGWEFTADSAQVTVSGNDVVLGDGATVANSSAHLQAFSATVVTQGDLTIDAQDSGLSFQDIEIANGSTVEFDTGTSTNSAITGVVSGAANLTKTGTGTLTMSGNGSNTYTGTTTVSSGLLELAKINGQPANDHGTSIRGDLVIDAGATVRLLEDSQIGDSNSVSLNGGTFDAGGHDETITGVTFNGGGQVSGTAGGSGIGFTASNGITTTGTGAATFSANIRLEPGSPTDENPRQFNTGANAPLTISGNISNGDTGSSASIEKSGAGTMTLSGTNTYTGGTTVSAGTLAGTTSSLQGNITNNSNVTFNQSTPGTYGGNMSGSGSLTKVGSGNVTLSAPNTYTGGTTVSAGTLTGTNTSLQGNVVNNAAVVFDQSTDGNWGGTMSGTGSLTKTGTGSITLTGTNTYTGNTTVSAGRLAVDGSITSHTSVGASGTLGGSGTITGNVDNSGTLAPGNSIDTLTVAGTYAHSPAAQLEVEINDGGQVPGTNNDLVDVSGTATIDGGAVNVVAESGNYNAHWKYTFLTATSVNGTFDSIADNLAFLDAVLGYESDSVYFTLFRTGDPYQSIAETFNQRAVAEYLDSISSGAAGDVQGLLDQINMLTDEDALAAYDQLSGELHGTLSQVQFQNLTVILSQLARRLRAPSLGTGRGSRFADSAIDELSDSPVVLVSYTEGLPQFQCCDARARRPRWNGWAIGFGLGGNAESDANAAGLDYRMGGALAGMECQADECHRAGFYGGYAGTGVDTRSPVQSAEIHGGHFGGYLTGTDGLNYYSVVSGMQFDQYRTERVLQIGNIQQVADGDTDGWQSFAYLERGLTLRPTCRATLQPYAALQYIHLRRNGFTETGAGAANLEVAGLDEDSLRSLLGGRLQLLSRTRNGRPASPELRAIWLHEFLDTAALVNARFGAAGGSSFAASGLDLGRDWALLGGGMAWDLGYGWQARGDYDVQLNDRQVFHVGAGSISYSW